MQSRQVWQRHEAAGVQVARGPRAPGRGFFEPAGEAMPFPHGPVRREYRKHAEPRHEERPHEAARVARGPHERHSVAIVIARATAISRE